MKDVLDERQRAGPSAATGSRSRRWSTYAALRATPAGAKMAVNERGEIAGAVSGGCVEGAVVEIAEEVIDGAPPSCVHFGIADDEAWDVGLPCGGEIDVWIQEYQPGRFAEIARDGGRAAEVTLLEGARARREAAGRGRRRPLGHARRSGARRRGRRGPAAELLWAERSERRGPLFIDVVAPAPRLILFGAVDIAASLCTLARDAGWRPYVVDPRARFATPERFPDAEEVIAAWPEEAFARLGGIDPATSIAVLTHDPKLDDAALGDRAAISRAVHRRDGFSPRSGGAARAAARAGLQR